MWIYYRIFEYTALSVGEWRASSDYRPAGSRRSLTSHWSLRIFEMLGNVKKQKKLRSTAFSVALQKK
jgi:hypothetical protein